MEKKMKFTKMQGLGNDYVYVNCFKEKIEDPSALAVRISDRHFGVGSDGLILINPSKVADCEMEMYNADGSRGEMCGNGIRCMGKYAVNDTATEVRHLRNLGVSVLGVFAGEEKDLSTEKKIFGKDFAYIRNISNFSRIVGRYLIKQLDSDE